MDNIQDNSHDVHLGKVYIKNFKNIEEVDFDTAGSSVYLIGPNEIGKSSVLEALWIMLTGKEVPSDPVKQGEKESQMQCTLTTNDGKEYLLEMVFKRGSRPKFNVYLNGEKQNSPRSVVTNLIGDVSFDVFEFLTMSGEKQKQVIKELVGVDFDDLDKEIDAQMEERKFAKRTLSEKQGFLSQSDVDPTEVDIFKEPKDVDQLQRELNDAIRKNAERTKGESLLESYKTDKERVSKQLAETTDQYEKEPEKLKEVLSELDNELARKIRELQAEYGEKKAKETQASQDRLDDWALSIGARQEELENINERIKAGEKFLNDNPVISEAQIRQKLDSAKLFNKKVEKVKGYSKTLDEIDALEAQIKDHTKMIESLRDEKITRLQAAKFPVPNLSMDEDGLTLDGLPFNLSQISTGRCMLTGAQIMMAKDPRLKILRFKNFSLMDEKKQKAVQELLLQHGYQGFFEVVESGSQRLKIEIAQK